MYEIIRSPVITEESRQWDRAQPGDVQRAVEREQPAIRAAVEGLFKVKVKAVNTLRQQGKVKGVPWHWRGRRDYKKAIVCAGGRSLDRRDHGDLIQWH